MASTEYPSSVTILLFLIPFCLPIEASERHVKFQYKHSFKGPHLVNKEGTIPFWTHGGSKWYLLLWFAIDISLHVYKNSLTAFLLTRAFFLGAIPSDDQIRLTPSMTNKKGKVFKVYFDEQLIHCLVTFRIRWTYCCCCCSCIKQNSRLYCFDFAAYYNKYRSIWDWKSWPIFMVKMNLQLQQMLGHIL